MGRKVSLERICSVEAVARHATSENQSAALLEEGVMLSHIAGSAGRPAASSQV